MVCKIVVAKFSSCYVRLEDFYSLKYPNQLNTEIMDIVSYLFTRNSEDVMAIDWLSVVKLFENTRRFIGRAHRKPFHVDLERTKLILMPYISKNHYTLLVLDLKNQYIVQHNPMPDFEILSNEAMLLGVKRYFHLYNKIKKKRNLILTIGLLFLKSCTYNRIV